MNLIIDNKEYLLQWGMGALEMFCDALDCEILDLEKALNPGRDQTKYLVTLIECALKNGAEKDSYYDDFEVSYRKLQRFLDEAPDGTLKDIIDDFKKSKYLGKSVGSYLFGEVEEEVAGAETDQATGKKKLPSGK